MISLFSLLPLFAALLVYLPIRRNFRSEVGLAVALSLLSLAIGASAHKAGLLLPSLCYSVLFGLFEDMG